MNPTGPDGLRLAGRVWKLGHDVSSDDLISARHVFEYDPRQLRRHILAEVRPAFAEQARPGDLLLAGRRFAHGSQHSHPFLALREMGMGLLALPLARPAYRLAVYMGVPLMELDEDAYAWLDDGDTVQADFTTGLLRRAGDADRSGRPLPAFLQDIVRAGGGLEFMRPAPAAAVPSTLQPAITP